MDKALKFYRELGFKALVPVGNRIQAELGAGNRDLAVRLFATSEVGSFIGDFPTFFSRFLAITRGSAFGFLFRSVGGEDSSEFWTSERKSLHLPLLDEAAFQSYWYVAPAVKLEDLPIIPPEIAIRWRGEEVLEVLQNPQSVTMNLIEDKKSIELQPNILKTSEPANNIDSLVSSLFFDDNTEQIISNNNHKGTNTRKQVLVVTPDKQVAPKLIEPLPNSATVSPYEKHLGRLRLTSPLTKDRVFADRSPELLDFCRSFLTGFQEKYPGTLDYQGKAKGTKGAKLRASNPKFQAVASVFTQDAENFVVDLYERNAALLSEILLPDFAGRFLRALDTIHSYYGSPLSLAALYQQVQNGPFPAAIKRHRIYGKSEEHLIFGAMLRTLQHRDTSKPVFMVCQSLCEVFNQRKTQYTTWNDRFAAFVTAGFLEPDYEYVNPNYHGRKPNYYWVLPILDED